MGLYWAHHHAGRYEEAEPTARQGVRFAPGNPTFRRQLAAALAEYLRLSPDHTTADAARVPCRDPEVVARFVEGLRRAGLPEPA